jgi:hypothetical protein
MVFTPVFSDDWWDSIEFYIAHNDLRRRSCVRPSAYDDQSAGRTFTASNEVSRKRLYALQEPGSYAVILFGVFDCFTFLRFPLFASSR